MGHPCAALVANLRLDPTTLAGLLSEALSSADAAPLGDVERSTWVFIERPTDDGLAELRLAYLEDQVFDTDALVMVCGWGILHDHQHACDWVRGLQGVSYVEERALEGAKKRLVEASRRAWHEYQDGLFSSPLSPDVLAEAQAVLSMSPPDGDPP